MIPRADIISWRYEAPWISDAQVEQDLLICRVLVEIYQNEALFKHLAFRGGTALHKLYLKPPRRYSEDIDLVQVKKGSIGHIIDSLHFVIDPLLGEPQRKQRAESFTLIYKTESEVPPISQLKLKVEINTREHFSILGLRKFPFEVNSRWFKGSCQILTFALEELLGTKVRALYQRRKGRDLFDLWLGLISKKANPDVIVDVFKQYMKNESLSFNRQDYLENLEKKMQHPGFLSDLEPLAAPNINYDVRKAYSLVVKNIISKI